ncbi:phage tail assembly protein [Govanella unica]|uniref:Phage tail assembly protein n=1 Tax=Govanella unica TaxID=2975056 RepID=A0A9X3TWD6_9PROT|nr:phage tail assembly protein [Govania unica]MDA5192789.1 phage tail assembly protein [Govania unica]
MPDHNIEKTKAETSAVVAAAASPNLSAPVDLDEIITRGEQKIAFVQIRKPASGELRGLSLIELGQLHIDSLLKVLPRITVPTLTAQEVAAMPLCDLLACGAEVASFLLRKRDREAASPDA